jgi:hypothetical protein
MENLYIPERPQPARLDIETILGRLRFTPGLEQLVFEYFVKPSAPFAGRETFALTMQIRQKGSVIIKHQLFLKRQEIEAGIIYLEEKMIVQIFSYAISSIISTKKSLKKQDAIPKS